jgi:hypothetical protein
MVEMTVDVLEIFLAEQMVEMLGLLMAAHLESVTVYDLVESWVAMRAEYLEYKLVALLVARKDSLSVEN